MIDFQNRRAIVVEGYDTIMTFTSVQDLARVVVRAVDLECEWPTIGGISGNRMPVSEIIKIGEKVRGKHAYVLKSSDYLNADSFIGASFNVETVKVEDLERGVLTASWKLEASHPSVPADQIDKMQRDVLIGTLLGGSKGAWDVSKELNELLPDFEFTRLETFLADVWRGKP